MQIVYISYKTAQIAKEKGYNIESYFNNSIDIFGNIISAIPQSLLQKWFREFHRLHICINFSIGSGYMYIIHSEDMFLTSSMLECDNDTINYKTYEEALEVALQKSFGFII